LILPRNEYTRVLAREAGRRRRRAMTDGLVRINDGPLIWHDPCDHLTRADAYEAEAYEWRRAWWCSENVGVRISGGALTLKALVAHLAWLAIWPMTIGAVGLGAYLVMWLGRVVLP
jgi:hypothetical protein